MATQTIHFGAGAGVTAAKLYTPGSDTLVATGATPARLTNSLRWTSAFTDVAAGTYILVATNSGGIVVAEWYVDLLLATASYQVYDYAGADAEGAGSDYSAELAAIQAKTDLITSQSATMQTTPVRTLLINRGDSYSGATAKTFAVTTDYTGYTPAFTIRHRVTDSVLATATPVVTSSVLITISLTPTQTAFADLLAGDEFGPHPWDVQFTLGSVVKTESGIAIVSKDQTRA